MDPPTPRRILVPLDGSRLAERIVPRLTRLLGGPPDEALLLHVTPERTDEAGARDGLDSLERMQHALHQSGVASTCLQRGGDPAEVILGMTGELAPFCIAMSTHGRSGVGRWWAGSVTERVLREARRPVLTANPGALDGAGVPAAAHPFVFERVVVPLDGSPLALAVLPLVRDLAGVAGGAVHLVSVRPAGLDGSGDRWLDEDFGGMLAEVARSLVAVDVRVDTHLVSGHPATAILDLAASLDADGIVLSTHGRAGLSRWAFGSVAEKVLRHAPCPVMVSRAPRARESSH